MLKSLFLEKLTFCERKLQEAKDIRSKKSSMFYLAVCLLSVITIIVAWILETNTNGVESVASSETLLNIKLKDTNLIINGQNMHITKLDISTGMLEVTGDIESLKYGKKVNVFKRIFK